jgi:molybdopterin synthase sulfur carrier subunit
MIFVNVKAILELAVVLGSREQVVSLPEASRVCDLLNDLEGEYGKPFAEILYENENRQLRSGLHLLLNGRNVVFLDGTDTRLKDGDELFFLSPVSGG